MHTPKYFAVINNPAESRRDHPLNAQDADGAMQEIQKFHGSLMRGGSVHVIENGMGEVGSLNQAGQVTRHEAPTADAPKDKYEQMREELDAVLAALKRIPATQLFKVNHDWGQAVAEARDRLRDLGAK